MAFGSRRYGSLDLLRVEAWMLLLRDLFFWVYGCGLAERYGSLLFISVFYVISERRLRPSFDLRSLGGILRFSVETILVTLSGLLCKKGIH